MKYFLNSTHTRARWVVLGAFLFALGGTLSALGELPSWIRNVESATALEAVFFRVMSLPGGAVPFRRPPHETRPALTELLKTQPQNAELYSLRALEDEQQLDFAAAESDWKSYAVNSSDKITSRLALADFYHRRLRPADEIKALSVVADAAPLPTEKLTPPAQQRPWQAFERIFGIIQEQGLSKDTSITQYRAWIARYPQEPSLYARFLQFLVVQKEYAAAGQLIASYHKQFATDPIFPIKAKAMVEYRQGSMREGLAVYEQSFQPLWDPELVKSYFDLLRETQSLRKFLDQARASLNANPEDLNAMARVFYYYQQQGKLEAAQESVADFRLHKESSKSPWTSQELYVCARLLEDIHAYPESARYYFALYNGKGMPDAQEQAIAGLANILFTAPETPIRFGAGELSMYRDIATMDPGPGYLNGILSLILNTTEPASQYSQEERRAIPYFHRSRAAELLALLDTKFPNSATRPELHAKLIEFYAGAGESDAVIQGGREFLAKFANAPQRTSVALLMADAFSRKNDTTNEFAIYDSVLQELAANAQNVPLGEASANPDFERYSARTTYQGTASSEAEGSDEEEQSGSTEQTVSRRRPAREAFRINSASAPAAPVGARSPEYARVLERYLARLVEVKQVPQALGVLRREIDGNPDDPGLYERLAVFLDQNRLGTEQEEVYRRAMAHFSNRSWYDKLARFYLRYKRESEFDELTRDAIKTFDGTDLENYFSNVYGSPWLYLRLNQYANQRFPHNPVFIHNLLRAYLTRETYNLAAWEALIRRHWFEETDLRNQFFEYLSRTGKLESELNALRQDARDANTWESNPAAADFLANANLWRSHFEESAPELKSLAAQYPAEIEIAHTASSVYRSLAYFDPSGTTIAAKIEDNLARVNPRDTETLARIGDIYADRDQFSQAAPYWERIPQVSPGQPGGYVEAATIYWDYYDFDNALRLLHEGRDHLGNPNLYSYEAGAIYENKRDYPRAVEEYVRGALENAGSSAEFRLFALARRPKFRDLVDHSTASIAAQPNPPMAAVYLRVKVLEAQNRKQDMESFLDGVANNATSMEQAEDVETLAEQKSLETVRQHALEKQIALTTDPVTRLQLRYALIRLYEGRKDFPSAERNVEALYRENPKILGVVRSTIDFYWRAKDYAQAISVLLQAAKDAYPDLSKQFAFEAARKATDAKQYRQARDLLAQLLENDPYNGEYLAAMADAYARAGDDRGLQQFYTDKIALFRNPSLSMPADTRKSQIASLRGGLIPALTRMKDYPGGVDQYIELINNFPEDDALVTEAALYAQRYQRQQQLVSFYAKTVAQSPRDYRWAMVLASVQTNLEDYPAAIDTYAKAITIRPDRTDLFIARVGLEERLLRFDEAISDYERIYELAYKDPQWMEKVAETRARQGKTKETVAALRAALINGRPESAANYFEAARRLESWEMLSEARSLAEEGIKAAGPDLLTNSEFLNGAKTYVRIMTRLRQHEQAYATIQNALADASSNIDVLEEQVAKQGIAAITNQQWRARVHQNRIDTARNGMSGLLQEMGNTVNAYFTPEERGAFSTFAESKRKTMDIADTERFAIPLVQSAALADQEAHWRLEVMVRGASPYWQSRMQALIDLQGHRGRFAELANQLEQFAGKVSIAPSGWQITPLLAAADAYRSAGDQSNGLRILNSISRGTGNLDSLHQQRLFELLLARQPDELVRIASNWTAAGEKAAEYVVANGDAALAHNVVQARGRTRPPVWNKSYNALVGLYFAESTSTVNGAFLGALGDSTIAERLSKPLDRSQQLAGGTWFYYGSRYGEYLGTTRQGHPEDFLPAILEQSPATASSYLTLADYYAGAGETKRAIADYERTLELSPNRPDVYDDLALAYYKQGDRVAAEAQWRQALGELSKQLNSARLPESFWADFGRTCDQLRSRHLFADLRTDVDAIIRTYLRHNGNWRSNALLEPAYLAIGDPPSATKWLIDLSSSAQDPTQVLSDVVDASWIPLAQRAPIYQHILESKQAALGKLTGLERDSAQQELGQWQMRWIKYLVLARQYAQAADAIVALPRETRDAQVAALLPLDLQIAAQLGTLDSKIAAYRSVPQEVPPSNILRDAARQLFEAGDKQSARKILEFVFSREIDEHQLVAANFLGLAEIRLASGDTPGTLDLLRRLAVVVGNPFENLDPAAALLEKTGHNAEAIEFLNELVKSSPWEPSYRLRLAKAKIAAAQDTAAAQGDLFSMAAESKVLYDLRVKAALAVGTGRTRTDLGSGELNLLAEYHDAIPANLADKFYFYEGRIKAAQNVADPQLKMQLLSHCIIDFPRRDQARVPLFQSAVSARSDEFALAVIEPLFQPRFLGSYGRDEQEIIASDNTEDDENDESNLVASAAPKLSRAQQAQVAQMIGDTMVRFNRSADAVHYFEIARRSEASADVRKVLNRKIAALKAALRIQHQNAARQPLLHEALEQDRTVRPRLLARAAPAQAATSKGGLKP